MPNFANISVAGHLGRDPETRHTQSGQSITAFSVATNKKRGQEDITTWWACQCWGKRGEVIAQYLRKGDAILVAGECYLHPWTAQDGQQRQSLEIDVRDFSFMGKAAETAAQAPSAAQAQPATASSAAGAQQDFDDDIPF